MFHIISFCYETCLKVYTSSCLRCSLARKVTALWFIAHPVLWNPITELVGISRKIKETKDMAISSTIAWNFQIMETRILKLTGAQCSSQSLQICYKQEQEQNDPNDFHSSSFQLCFRHFSRPKIRYWRFHYNFVSILLYKLSFIDQQIFLQEQKTLQLLQKS